jgi:hypothetical protein
MKSAIMKTRRVLGVVLAGIALAGVFGSSARADYIFDLGVANFSGYAGPYVQVDVHLTNSTNATITFTSLTNSGDIYLMGDGGTVGVNVNAASWTLNSITGLNTGTGFAPGPFSNGGAGNEDGFGSFNQTITSFDGFKNTSSTVVLTLNDMSGSWSSAQNVLVANADGNFAAAHVFVTSSPADASNGALTTGFVSDVAVPGPVVGTGLPGVVAACGGLFLLARRRRQRMV